MRGRKPKPIQQQINEGDPRQRGVHKLDERKEKMPKAEQGLGDCPAELGAIARSAWNFFSLELLKSSMAFRMDRMLLEGICIQYERAKVAEQFIQKNGMLVIDIVTDREGKPTGQKRIRNNPAIAIANASWVLFRSLCSEIGLSPVSRQRLEVQQADTTHEELMQLLTAPRVPKERVQ
jgi:P27 family predicted phage terminase small subunit